MKYLLLLIPIFAIGCSSPKVTAHKDFSLKNEINNSIVDGFFGGDTTNIPDGAFFLK